jgi:glycosyltransferase involved in cell wall biosynthesis
MVFNIPIISNIVFSPFKYLCNGIYKRADEICAVSDTYCLRALRTNKKVKHTITVFLGTELSVFDKNSKNNRVNKTEKKLWMGYCGSMGDSYDLKTVIDALALLDDPPLFIAMGDGEKKSKFEQYAKEKKVDCLFTGKLPYDQMCGWLGRCDMVVNPIVGNSVASIINKHADYAASGLPVLNTQNSNEYKKLVEEYNMGFNCESENPKELSEKINKLVIDKKLRTTMGENARRCAEERFDRKNTYDGLVKAILSEYMV